MIFIVYFQLHLFRADEDRFIFAMVASELQYWTGQNYKKLPTSSYKQMTKLRDNNGEQEQHRTGGI